MGRTFGCLAAALLMACAPGSTTGDGILDEDAPAPRDVAPTMDAGETRPDVPRVDALAATDREAPLDVVAVTDLGGRLDVGDSIDVSVARDVIAVTDLGAPDVGCVLPPPVARPPAAGPDGSGVIRALAAERPDWLRNSCLAMGGDHRFLFEALRRGRAVDPRWGLDRRLGPLSGDIVTYFWGDGCPEGRREVYMFDIITRHCAQPGVDEPPAPGWIDRSAEGGVWTLQGYDPGLVVDAGAPVDGGPPPPDVPRTRPPLPDGRATLEAVAREHPDWLRNSCVADGGDNRFLFEVVRRLRRIDTRWGLNWKRGRIGDMSQDVVNYFYGPSGAPMEGSLDTYVVDVIGGHCGPTPSTAWIDQTGVGGAEARWTLAGRTDL
jgi:hypothetical protein